jgi:hypothetical protein
MITALAVSGCKTVSRSPVDFATASHGERRDVEYEEAGWVVGRSCEQYAGFFDRAVEAFQLRVGERERPRSVRAALEAALEQEPRARFLANMVIENEVTSETFVPLKVCTVVSGVAMVRADGSVRRTKRPDAAPTTSAPPPHHTAPSSTTDRPVVGSDVDDD